MVTKPQASRVSPSLERRIEGNRAEVARFRAEHGDPAEALDRFIRETFSEEALIDAYEEYLADQGWDREKTAMATKIADVRLSPGLAELIGEHRAEVARLRAEVGDPEEALSAFVREHFDQDALAFAYDAMLRYPGA